MGELSESDGSFPETRWSLVLRLKAEDERLSSMALEEVCSRYWFPIYSFLRSRGNSIEDAEDLTQQFFAHLASHETLKAVEPEKGKLRTFLLSVLTQVTARDFRRRSAQKRGAGHTHFSFDTQSAEKRYEAQVAASVIDDHTLSFDRAWASEVLNRAWSTLRDFYDRKGRAGLLEALEPFVSWNEGDGDYREIARQFGIRESSIRLHVFRIRQRLRENLEREVMATLSDPAELESEVRHLVALTASRGPR